MNKSKIQNLLELIDIPHIDACDILDSLNPRFPFSFVYSSMEVWKFSKVENCRYWQLVYGRTSNCRDIASTPEYRKSRERYMNSEFAISKEVCLELRKDEKHDKTLSYLGGIATVPICLNIAINKYSPFKSVVFNYFHECGHLLNGPCETSADDYAFQKIEELRTWNFT